MGDRTLSTNPLRASSWEFQVRNDQPVKCVAKFMGEGARGEAEAMHVHFMQMPEGPRAANHIVRDTFSDTDATLTVTDPALVTAIQFWIDTYMGLATKPYTVSEAPPPEPPKPERTAGRAWEGKVLRSTHQRNLPFKNGPGHAI